MKKAENSVLTGLHNVLHHFFIRCSLKKHTGARKKAATPVSDEVLNAINHYITLNGDDREMRHYILETMPGNRNEVALLVKAGYADVLWDEGIAFEAYASTEMTGDDLNAFRKSTINNITGQSRALGIITDEDIESVDMNDEDSVAELFVKVKNGLLRQKREMPDDYDEDAHYDIGLLLLRLRDHDHRTFKKKTGLVHIEIKKDFSREARSGEGVPGCFDPKTGYHREMPLIHALEANAFIARAYDENGEELSNITLALTDKGAVVFTEYSASSYNLDPVWAQAWGRLLKYAPAVILAPESAGRLYFEKYSIKKSFFTALKRNAVFESDLVHTEFGKQKDNGIRFNIHDGIVVTKKNLPR